MDEFMKALQEFNAVPAIPIEFRAYYRTKDGSIIGYTTEQWSGEYIIVDQQIFHENRFDLRIKDGKLVYPRLSVGKLRPAQDGTPCHPNDITIVIPSSPAAQHWKIHTYED